MVPPGIRTESELDVANLSRIKHLGGFGHGISQLALINEPPGNCRHDLHYRAFAMDVACAAFCYAEADVMAKWG